MFRVRLQPSSGVQETIYSHRYRVYTDKLEVAEGKTVKNKLELAGTHIPAWLIVKKINGPTRSLNSRRSNN
jgi:hypothetical protein